MEENTVSLDEAAARQVLLVRALEEADPEGRIVGTAERDAIELEVLRAVGPAALGGPAQGAFLQRRAQGMLAAVAKRQSGLAGLQHAPGWWAWLPWVLPLATCVAGAALDRIDNPQHVNMLSPPLLGVLAWNLLAYLLFAAGALGLWKRLPALPMDRVLAGWTGRSGRTGRLRADVTGRFHALWFTATRARMRWGVQQLLHWMAAGWALGLALSITIGGLVRQYKVGWESTLLDPGAVHAVLSVLFWPVVALLPFDGFSTADLQRMAFGAQPPAGVLEARRWVWMYLALLALVVIVPRVLLALWAGWRRRAAGPVAIDVADPYFSEILARAGRAESMQVLARWLLQAARDTEVVPVGPGGLRRLLDPSQREHTERSRDLASGALLQRLRATEREAAAALRRIHGTALPSGAEVPGGALQVQWRHPMDSQQAGLAGVASGAAMGLGVDAALGGMTLGAAAALGALIGGTIGLTAAVRKNKTAADGQSLVQWGDDVLQTLTEHAVLAFLAVARRRPEETAVAEPAWRSEVVAAVEHRREALAAIWSQARGGDDAALVDGLAEELEGIARAVTARL